MCGLGETFYYINTEAATKKNQSLVMKQSHTSQGSSVIYFIFQ